MSLSLYFDHAATTPLLPQARDALLEGMARWANPSSPHAAGRAARAALEDARARIKAALGWPGEVVLTSGASEALALAIGRAKAPLMAVSAVEHEAVLRLAGDAARLAVDGRGQVVPASSALAGLVAVQQVNNETGVIQPLAAVAQAVRDAGGVLLADAAQGAGKLPLPEADLIAISAHKFGGPIGVGALLVRDWALLHPTGGQERGYRPGTENLPGALAMAAALEAGNAWLADVQGLRDRLETALLEIGAEVIAADAPRLPAIGAYRMPGKSATAQLIRFDGMGMAVSAGSACSSGSLRTSHVLDAMGVAQPNEVIRVSLGRETTVDAVDRFVAVWRAIAGLA
ncbi:MULTISPECIES: cysteine desulfurase family protein [unclassified Novosphingobium]|uniref:cysteine desulfurase family protein n=1 Tax=unclassified Novosphingobium TaxID=2644732 RepID=UPI000D302DD1|nr:MULTISPECIES: aminotransferase class V-fold PLP-dependent enzyme [unclassified Novosphingobium]PTR08811.1 cysteine desulfurase [Novosphingobium sp. GV055]PUB01723.1 cysteine desulfurase [Novosphingobium sp. GV061]PUB17695.1 cysteine desulfurase [Novosphingobium sp. GV079]PUB40389.1 cysteine desulfurase [Novosphingobium sp. GV027]